MVREIIKQPNTVTGLPTPDIASDIDVAKAKLQVALKQLGVTNFTPKEFGLLWRKGWSGPPQQLPEDLREMARLILLLDWIRIDFGLALSPGSTFRPMAYNTQDGQSSGSQHLWARASDLRPANNTSEQRLRLYHLIKRNLPIYRARLAEFYDIPEKHIKFGLKLYAGFVHVDLSVAGEIGARTRDWIPKLA